MMRKAKGRSWIPRLLKAVLVLLLLAILLPVAVVFCVVVFEIPLNLSSFRPRLEAIASKSMKREVTMGGAVQATLRRSLAVEIKIEKLRISGKDPAIDLPLLEAGRVEAGLRLPALRKKEIILSLVDIEDTEISIPPRKRKASPPAVAKPEERTPEQLPEPGEKNQEVEVEEDEDDFDLIGIDRIRLKNVLIRHKPRKAPEIREDVIENLEGTAVADQPLTISATGIYQGLSSSADLEIFDPIEEIMDLDHASTASVDVVVGETKIEGTAVIDFSGETPSVTVEAATQSPSLYILSRVINEDWPDVGPIDGSLTFFYTREVRRVENIRAKMGSTYLNGHIYMTRDKQRELYFTAEQAVLGDVFKVIEVDAEGLEGTVNRVEFKMTQPGGSRIERKRNRSFLVTASGGKLRYEYEGREYLTLDVNDLYVSRTPGTGDVARLDGVWLGKDIILDVKRSPPREEPDDDRREVELRLEGAGTRLFVEGLLRGKRLNKETDLQVSLESERVGDLNAWLDVNPECDLPLDFHTRLRQSKERLGIEALRLTMGENNLNAEFSQANEDGTQSIFARLKSDRLAVDEISAAGFQNILKREKRKPEPNPAEAPTVTTVKQSESKDAGLELEVPIWPDPIDIPDVDLDCTVDHFIVGSEEMRGLKISGNSMGGDVESAAVEFSYGETTFDGRFSLKLSEEIPVGTLDVVAENVDVSDLLLRRNIVEDTTFRADRIELHTVGRGSTLSELLRWSDFSIVVNRGQYSYARGKGSEAVEVAVERVEARALQDEPVTLNAIGTVNGEPLSIGLRSDLSRSEIHRIEHVPLELGIEGFGVDLNFIADVNLPLDKMNHTFDFRIAGDSLANVATNFVRLPPLGPYELSAHLDIDEAGYALTDLNLALASSRLNGSVALVLNEERPRFDIALTAPTLQLDELFLSDWVSKKDKKKDKKKEVEVPAVEPEPPKEKKPSTMEYLLENVDGHIQLNVDEVASGGDFLGAGVFEATLSSGRIDIDPLYVAFGDGELELQAGFEESVEGISAELRLNAQQFDYGVLARRMDRKSDMEGKISIDAEIWGEGKDWEDLADHANGFLHLGVFPENLDASILDLWAANLIMALARKADDPRNSKFNCLMGRFALNDGLFTDRTIVLDTTRVRVNATGKIDLRNDEIRLKLKPRSKSPAFFSLETAITVKGSLHKPKISLKGWDVTKSVGGFIFSIITVPFQWMGADPPPKDGSDVCAEWEKMMK